MARRVSVGMVPRRILNVLSTCMHGS